MTNQRKTLTITNISDKNAAFAIDMETGEAVHMRPQIVKAQGITAEDIGKAFDAWVMPPQDGKYANVVAFIGWSDDDADADETQKLRQQLTDTRRELIAAQGKLEMIRDALERGPVKLAV